MNRSIKVMSFNMKRNYLPFGKNRWEDRSALVAQVIRQNAPDIVGTQELTNASLCDMQHLLPEYEQVGNGRGGGQRGEYTAIFYLKSQFKALGEETFWLSRTPQEPSRAWLAIFPRICTTCLLQLRDAPNVNLRIYNTHLDHISYLARINGLKLIIKHMNDHPSSCGKVHTVLMGDFNATPASKTLRAWESRLRVGQTSQTPRMENSYNQLLRSSQDIGRSYHGFHGTVAGNPIDYIFTSKDILPRSVEIRRDNFDSVYPSDHYPVIAELELL
ncbi:MAG: endonuclease/exonuclease/phosphatase family protein [Angelakisella sp.]